MLRIGRLAAAVAIFGVDTASKAWADAVLRGRGTIWIWRPWFSLYLLHNPGATLGFGAGHPRLLIGVSALAVVALVALVWRVDRGGWGLALMLGGAAGNLGSRLAHGAVTDFLRLWLWPGVFNLADVALRLGAILIVITLLRSAALPGPTE